jgi:L,D-transpeptidase-like protein
MLAVLAAAAALAAPASPTYWAYVMHPTVARADADAEAVRVGILRGVTPEGETNLVISYEEQRDSEGRLWVHVPLSTLPNGREGWVQRDSLGDFHKVLTRLVIDRARLRAYLLKNGRTIFETAIGVGRPRWPTPAGEFYVRVRLEHFRDSMYGPVAFGTNARSPWLTDWPKGGVIGIHGTDTPQLLPGRISHGCIRMRNAAIRRLARLMPLGTPVSIR